MYYLKNKIRYLAMILFLPKLFAGTDVFAHDFLGRNSCSLKGYRGLKDRSASNSVQLLTFHLLKGFGEKRKEGPICTEIVYVIEIQMQISWVGQSTTHTHETIHALYSYIIITSSIHTLSEKTESRHMVILFFLNRAIICQHEVNLE